MISITNITIKEKRKRKKYINNLFAYEYIMVYKDPFERKVQLHEDVL
jgi:hypothetical protein